MKLPQKLGCVLSIQNHDIVTCVTMVGGVPDSDTGVTSDVAVPSTDLVDLSDNLISSFQQTGAY